MPTEYYQVRGYDSETGIPTVSGWSAWDWNTWPMNWRPGARI